MIIDILHIQQIMWTNESAILSDKNETIINLERQNTIVFPHEERISQIIIFIFQAKPYLCLVHLLFQQTH